jgi:hypothetical protein
MKAEDLATYFSKKIAKLIPFHFVLRSTNEHRYYSVEPIAVRDNELHAMVHFKYETDGPLGAKWGPARQVGEVQIPLHDG